MLRGTHESVIPKRRLAARVSAGRVFALMAEHTGWDHLAIGSDLDGGIGVEESPVELDSIADLAKLGEVLPDEARAGVLGENWIAFLRRALPD